MDDNINHTEEQHYYRNGSSDKLRLSPIFGEAKQQTVEDENLNDSLEGKSTDNKGKIMLETISEMKELENKINLLKNRINKLHGQEIGIKKEYNNLQRKFVKEEKKKIEKIERKTEFEIIKLQYQKEVEEKKRKIEKENMKRKEILVRNAKESFYKNRKNFTNAKSERVFIDSIQNDIKSHTSNMKKLQMS